MVKQNRREFLKAMGLGVGSLVFSGCMEGIQKPRKKPNIVIFFTDDQQYDTIAALGNKQIITPNLDSLVHNGTSFTNAYIMGSMAGAVCMPSRSMLMTGRTLFHLCDDIYIIPQEHIQFPETLRKAGYTTFHTGKWHQDSKALMRSFSAGGKVFFGGMSDHYRTPVFDFDPEMKYPSRDELRELRIMENIMKREKGKHSTELFTDSAVEFLHEYKDEQPFFMYVSYTGPHRPWQAPEEYLKMYDAEKIKLPESFMPEHPFDLGEIIVDEKLHGWPRTEERIRKSLRNYYAMITHIDAQIGKVLQALKERGDFENTIVIFSSDNGLAMGRHGLVGKQSLYEHSMKVPLVMTGPGIGKGKKRDGFCYLLDIYPTLCEMVGISVPDSVEGESFAGTIRGSKQEIRKSLFFAYKDFQRGVREGRYKLIEYVVDGKRTTQLFDLQIDPREINNLADEPNYRETLRRLRKELLRWKDRLDDDSSFWKYFDATN